MPNSLSLFILKCIHATYSLGFLVTEVPMSQDRLGEAGVLSGVPTTPVCTKNGLHAPPPCHLVSKCVLTIMTNNEEVLASCLRRTKQRVFLQLSWTLAVATSAANGTPQEVNKRHQLCKLEQGCSLSAAALTGPWIRPS